MIKEELKKAQASQFFCIISYHNNDVYYQIKLELEKHFSKILFESNPMPKWRADFNLETGKNTNVLSFKQKINREEMPLIKKTTMEIKKKFLDKDALLQIIPGYLNPHNVIVASSSDDFHKIYLFNGVHAEIVYKYEGQKLLPMEAASDFFSNNDVIYYFKNLREAHEQTIR